VTHVDPRAARRAALSVAYVAADLVPDDDDMRWACWCCLGVASRYAEGEADDAELTAARNKVRDLIDAPARRKRWDDLWKSRIAAGEYDQALEDWFRHAAEDAALAAVWSACQQDPYAAAEAAAADAAVAHRWIAHTTTQEARP
jgi:hypothetical protein